MSGKPLAAVWLTAALVLATVAEARADAAGQAQPVLTRDPSQLSMSALSAEVPGELRDGIGAHGSAVGSTFPVSRSRHL